MENQLGLSGNEDQSDLTEELTTWEQQTVRRKKWVCKNGELVTANNKKVVPKRELFQVLCYAYNRVSHRGRQITEKWLQENYAEISQKVVNTFVQLCPYHAENREKAYNKPCKECPPADGSYNPSQLFYKKL